MLLNLRQRNATRVLGETVIREDLAVLNGKMGQAVCGSPDAPVGDSGPATPKLQVCKHSPERTSGTGWNSVQVNPYMGRGLRATVIWALMNVTSGAQGTGQVWVRGTCYSFVCLTSRPLPASGPLSTLLFPLLDQPVTLLCDQPLS